MDTGTTHNAEAHGEVTFLMLRASTGEKEAMCEQAVPAELPFVSIIVTNYNGRRFLKECFASLESVTYDRDRFEVILVDNASQDQSVEYTRECFPWVRILTLDKNHGFCKANNDGARAAAGEYIVLLNNDTVVTKDWLAELVKCALRDDRAVCCASKMLYYDRQGVINTAGGKITVIGGGFYIGYGDADGPEYSRQHYTGFGCGAGVLVKKDFFEQAGGFDEDYFASCEEHDLGWKAWLFGYRVVYVPTAVMYHREGGTFGNRRNPDPFKVYLNTRNRLYNIVKNFESKNVVRGLFVTLAFNLYRAARYAMSRNFAAVRSIMRGYIAFLRNSRRMLSKRKTVQKKRCVSDNELYKLGVIATLAESLAEERRLSQVLKDHFYKI